MNLLSNNISRIYSQMLSEIHKNSHQVVFTKEEIVLMNRELGVKHPFFFLGDQDIKFTPVIKSDIKKQNWFKRLLNWVKNLFKK